MNYYEHHLGDWAAATGHLTWDEDMAYTRLLRAYYHREQPIPQGQQYRLAKATTPTQRKAVDQVLSEFFELRNDDGCYHQKRADEEIARYREAEPEREAKRTNERERQQRTRMRRKELFDALRAAGVVPQYDAPMSELQALASRHLSQHLSRVTARDITDPITRDATATHTQTPDTSNTNTTVVAHAKPLPRAPGPDDDPPDPPPSPPPPAPPTEPTAAGAATLAMRAAGLADANPAHPTLLALLQAGVTTDELADAAAVAVAKGKGFAYAVAVAEGRRRDAASTGAAVSATPRPAARIAAGNSPPVRLSAYERELAAKRRQWEQMTGRIHPDNLPQQPPAMAEVIDITPAVTPLLARGAL